MSDETIRESLGKEAAADIAAEPVFGVSRLTGISVPSVARIRGCPSG